MDVGHTGGGETRRKHEELPSPEVDGEEVDDEKVESRFQVNEPSGSLAYALSKTKATYSYI